MGAVQVVVLFKALNKLDEDELSDLCQRLEGKNKRIISELSSDLHRRREQLMACIVDHAILLGVQGVIATIEDAGLYDYWKKSTL